ncbi:TetR/AcrR family transcriptional regulator [Psychrosphaera aquimarina]|jgi:AcrR family transcriptional regulator|uniref:TetR/AcrR family transcriptional regulator n=1 Tax=Psychrosphaera aquimarina TaxID=2044854 RepID=A0ABU3QXM6_9GAMM|nr:TetR/AcrR family transcriptional regulator [Psychrosphaera aquimarina]MDU0112176.1 TetR/AcrR family transcriptional regulator [Psychrosphaera aquimarina]
MEIKKAKNQKQKLQRVNGILAAAEALFVESGDELPSAIQIANKAEVAKGTLYIYFRTKEAIFLALLEKHLQNWIISFETATRKYETITVDDICTYLTQYWVETPQFGQLCRISDSLLESRVEEKVYIGFQNKTVNGLKRMVPALKELNPDVDSKQWLSLLQRSYQLLTLAWVESHPKFQIAMSETPNFEKLSNELLSPFWQELVQYRKHVPKQKSGWRKLLGN